MHRAHTTRLRRAFTLVELLVTVTVIVILTGIVLGVGASVIGGQKGRVTQSILLTLDRAYQEFVDTGGRLTYPLDPANIADPESYYAVPGETSRLFESYNPVSSRQHPLRPDAAVALRQMLTVRSVQDIVAEIPSQFTISTTVATGSDKERDPTPSVLDAWADPDLWPVDILSTEINGTDPYPLYDTAGRTYMTTIYFVFPSTPARSAQQPNTFQEGNIAAEFLYGKAVNQRPYFMSAGPDGLYGLAQEFPDSGDAEATRLAFEAVQDNLYSYPVQPPSRDAGGFR
ncbi:MAG: type II secretion system protein [Planctomycetota bacterium]